MNNRAIDLANELAYQNTAGEYTQSNCSMKGCSGSARGGTHCKRCVIKKLSEEIGAVKAAKLNYLYHKRKLIQSHIDKMIGEFSD